MKGGEAHIGRLGVSLTLPCVSDSEFFCGPAGVEDKPQTLESQIAGIEAQIKTAEENAKAAEDKAAENNADTKTQEYWRGKKSHWQEKERQLREEKLILLRGMYLFLKCAAAILPLVPCS